MWKENRIDMNDGLKLILRDVSSRIPYGVKCRTRSGNVRTISSVSISGRIWFSDSKPNEQFGEELCNPYSKVQTKPYLRKMSDMTEKEKDEYARLSENWFFDGNADKAVEFLDAHMFDHRGLIDLGLAIEAKSGVYNRKEETITEKSLY